MKTRNILISLAALAALSSCDLVELGGPSGGEESSATIIIGPADVQTRSSVGSTDSELTAFENRITDLTLFRYAVSGSSETLESATYYDLSSGSGTTRTITVSGDEGKTYKFYALLNCGDKSSAVSVGSAPSALQNITVTGLDLSSMQTDGIPMVNTGGIAITFGTTTSVIMPMTRMVARWDFKLDTSGLTHTTFTVTSLKLCQSPNRTSPFASANAFKSSSYVQDGDAATSSDIYSLSSGSAISYYVLENACGNLLSSNTDPWSKVPSSGTAVSGYYPTYIEMEGTLTDNSGYLVRKSYYRMYLGKNTTTNFDVERGTSYTLTFKPTEEPITDDIGDEWKCELESSSDTRNFHFLQESCAIPSGENGQVYFVGDKTKYGITFSLSCTGLSLVTSTPEKVIIANTEHTSLSTGTLKAYYWDGRLADECTIYGAATVQSPAAIYVESNTTTITSGSTTLIHNPDCPLDHMVHDDENCPYNHDEYIDHNEDNYFPVAQCPYTKYDDSDCSYWTYTSGSVVGESAFKATVRESVSVSGGKLAASYMTKDVTYNSDPVLGDAAGNDLCFSGGGIYSSPSISGTMNFAAQFRSTDCQYWNVETNLGHYILPIYATEGLQTAAYDCSLTYNSPVSLFEYEPTYSSLNHDEQGYYLLSDYVQFINLTHPSYSNRFLDGDKVIVAVKKDAPNTANVYALNAADGTIVRKSYFSTLPLSLATVDGLPFYRATDNKATFTFFAYSGFYDSRTPLTVTDIVGTRTFGGKTTALSYNSFTVSTSSDGVVSIIYKGTLNTSAVMTVYVSVTLADGSDAVLEFSSEGRGYAFLENSPDVNASLL